MLSINNLKPGIYIVYEGMPYEILGVQHLHLGRGSSSIQTKMRNLKTGQVLSRNFKPADVFKEAGILKSKVKYLYNHRGEFWFSTESNFKDGFALSENQLGDSINFLKPNTIVEALEFDEKILNINLPIKMDFKVIEAPPAIRGNTAQGGVKTVVIETGAKIITPLFINTGDVIRVNTQSGEYVERAEKSKT